MTTRAPSRPRQHGGRAPVGHHGRRAPARAPDPRHRPRRPEGGRTGTEHRRLLALLVVAVLAFGVVAYRVASLQVVAPDQLVAFGQDQRQTVTVLAAPRGSILDRHGADLALSVPSATIEANPQLIVDPYGTARALAPVLGLDVMALTETLSGESSFTYVQRQVPREVGEQIEALDLDGITVSEEPARANPSGELARSLLGRVGVDQEGLSGLEAQFEDVLAGEAGEVEVERDPQGNTIASGDNHYDPADQGDDLQLTIDRLVQFEAERLLAEQVAATGARGGIALVGRPATGELLAVANIDAYDEETGTLTEPVPATDNRAVTAVFEPGSVNKIITLSAALEERIATPDSTYVVPDSMQVGDHVFSDSHPHETAEMTVRDILTQSSNIGTIQIAQQLGAESIDRYLRAFGFGERTALDFPAESPGILLPPEEWSSTSIGTIPIGQGLAVTPLQVLQTFNVIANGGRYVAPRLVQGTIGADGELDPVEGGEAHQVVSEETAEQMTEMMTGVVDDGTGEAAAVEGYPVAGKTGTARKPQANGTYQDEDGNYHYVATFGGFVPA
ncbi:MAG TPA: penicillin-binding protein 2, partial [Acidimicrobiales bacterium]|nr:penicillin-binding protein 2 [Acidimicrobiales bacterium]